MVLKYLEIVFFGADMQLCLYLTIYMLQFSEVT